MKNPPISELIKQKRLEKNISVETIFKEAHVPSKFVYMIENGEWEKFPSEVHLKGFLKIYAGYLGIDPELVEKYIENAAEAGRKKDETPPCRRINEICRLDRSMCLLIILAVLLIIIYLLVLYVLPE